MSSLAASINLPAIVGTTLALATCLNAAAASGGEAAGLGPNDLVAVGRLGLRNSIAERAA